MHWWSSTELLKGEKGRATKRLMESLLLAVVMIAIKLGWKMVIHWSVESERLITIFDSAADLFLVLPAIIIVGAGALDVAFVSCKETYRSISGKENG